MDDKHSTRSLVRDGYNHAAERYQFQNQPYLERLLSLLPPRDNIREPHRILDLGCGSGMPSDRFLIEHGCQVIGLDIAEKQIELARQNVPQAEYTVADMAELRPGAYQVDAIVSFYAIFHTPRETHAALFQVLSSVLPPNGCLLASMGADEWTGVEEFHGVPMYWSHYAASTNTAFVAQAGFEILLDEIDSSGGEQHQIILAQKPG